MNDKTMNTIAINPELNIGKNYTAEQALAQVRGLLDGDMYMQAHYNTNIQKGSGNCQIANVNDGITRA